MKILYRIMAIVMTFQLIFSAGTSGYISYSQETEPNIISTESMDSKSHSETVGGKEEIKLEDISDTYNHLENIIPTDNDTEERIRKRDKEKTKRKEKIEINENEEKENNKNKKEPEHKQEIDISKDSQNVLDSNIFINVLTDNEQPLENVEFIVEDEIGVVISRGKTDEKGKVVFENLPQGIYYLVEEKVPKGYKKVDTKWELNVEKDSKTTVRSLKNEDEELVSKINNFVMESKSINDILGRKLKSEINIESKRENLIEEKQEDNNKESEETDRKTETDKETAADKKTEGADEEKKYPVLTIKHTKNNDGGPLFGGIEEKLEYENSIPELRAIGFRKRKIFEEINGEYHFSIPIKLSDGNSAEGITFDVFAVKQDWRMDEEGGALEVMLTKYLKTIVAKNEDYKFSETISIFEGDIKAVNFIVEKEYVNEYFKERGAKIALVMKNTFDYGEETEEYENLKNAYFPSKNTYIFDLVNGVYEKKDINYKDSDKYKADGKIRSVEELKKYIIGNGHIENHSYKEIEKRFFIKVFSEQDATVNVMIIDKRDNIKEDGDSVEKGIPQLQYKYCFVKYVEVFQHYRDGKDVYENDKKVYEIKRVYGDVNSGETDISGYTDIKIDRKIYQDIMKKNYEAREKALKDSLNGDTVVCERYGLILMPDLSKDTLSSLYRNSIVHIIPNFKIEEKRYIDFTKDNEMYPKKYEKYYEAKNTKVDDVEGIMFNRPIDNNTFANKLKGNNFRFESFRCENRDLKRGKYGNVKPYLICLNNYERNIKNMKIKKVDSINRRRIGGATFSIYYIDEFEVEGKKVYQARNDVVDRIQVSNQCGVNYYTDNFGEIDLDINDKNLGYAKRHLIIYEKKAPQGYECDEDVFYKIGISSREGLYYEKYRFDGAKELFDKLSQGVSKEYEDSNTDIFKNKIETSGTKFKNDKVLEIPNKRKKEIYLKDLIKIKVNTWDLGDKLDSDIQSNQYDEEYSKMKLPDGYKVKVTLTDVEDYTTENNINYIAISYFDTKEDENYMVFSGGALDFRNFEIRNGVLYGIKYIVIETDAPENIYRTNYKNTRYFPNEANMQFMRVEVPIKECNSLEEKNKIINEKGDPIVLDSENMKISKVYKSKESSMYQKSYNYPFDMKYSIDKTGKINLNDVKKMFADTDNSASTEEYRMLRELKKSSKVYGDIREVTFEEINFSYNETLLPRAFSKAGLKVVVPGIVLIGGSLTYFYIKKRSRKKKDY